MEVQESGNTFIVIVQKSCGQVRTLRGCELCSLGMRKDSHKVYAHKTDS